MNEQLSTALVVLLVGMITVFVVLSLVVLSGKVLISIVNKYAPDKAIKKPVSARTIPITRKSTSTSSSKVAAIVAAVHQITQGKGQITSIKKIP